MCGCGNFTKPGDSTRYNGYNGYNVNTKLESSYDMSGVNIEDHISIVFEDFLIPLHLIENMYKI